MLAGQEASIDGPTTVSDGPEGRVAAAVEHDGLSCHAAAERFGVAISTAIKWMQRYRRTGSVAPGQMGGHKPRKIAGAYREWLIERCHSGDFTLRGLVAELAERGLKVDYRSVWAFVHAERLSFKKNRARSRTGSPRRSTAAEILADLSTAD
jgi:transposase